MYDGERVRSTQTEDHRTMQTPFIDSQQSWTTKKQSFSAVEVAQTDLHAQVCLLEELVTWWTHRLSTASMLSLARC